jgi:hypothetical protein
VETKTNWDLSDDELDISFDEMKVRRRVTGRGLRNSDLPTLPERQIEEIRHFRAHGMSDEVIRKRLGIPQNTYDQRLVTGNIPKYTKSEDKVLRQVLDRVIEEGNPFTSSSLPHGSSPLSANDAINAARLLGRIVKVGKGKSDDGSPVFLWQKKEMAVDE